MKNISLAMAVYNEEENLAHALDSVANLVDEIIIVDGHSTDKTIAIAKKYKAKVISVPNRKMFHSNKQRAIDESTKAWVLQLDADETVSDGLLEEIKNLPQEGDISGYWIPRKNNFLGSFLKKGGQYPDYTLRLYRRGKGRLPCKDVHEQAEVDGKTEYVKSPLLHFPYPNFSHYLKHFDLYTSILADDLSKNKTGTGIHAIIYHCVLKPLHWFLKTYFRHKGFMDGFPGFIFSLFSSLRFVVAYAKYWEKTKKAATYA